MRQIYADFNDIDAAGVLPLTCQGSVASIAAQEDALREGEEVHLSDGELAATAWVSRRSDGSWEARSTWRFVR